MRRKQLSVEQREMRAFVEVLAQPQRIAKRRYPQAVVAEVADNSADIEKCFSETIGGGGSSG